MQRLDLFLLENNIVKSRKQAQDVIKSGGVFVDDKCITKCSQLVDATKNIQIKAQICPYVSRAGYKLQGAQKDFELDFTGKVVLDIGSSTGGFTDFCIQNGAKKVYCVDVGTNQLDKSLRENPKVIVMENTDIRTLTKQQVQDINFVVCDVSFISLTLISSKISELLNSGDFGVVLIKPQFECGKALAKKYKGVIKDEKIHKLVINSVTENFSQNGLEVKKVEQSAIKGGDGNTEFVALIQKK